MTLFFEKKLIGVLVESNHLKHFEIIKKISANWDKKKITETIIKKNFFSEAGILDASGDEKQFLWSGLM